MKKKVIQVAVAVLAACSWAGVAAAQGLYWESKTTGLGKGDHTTQTFVMPKMMKVVHSRGMVTVLRADQEKFITIEPEKKTYREMTFAELESAATAMQGQMDTARAEMEKRMKNLPAEQRAMMEKMMPKGLGAAPVKTAAVNIVNTGETKTVAGHSCTKQVAKEGDKTILVACTAKDVKGFEKVREDWIGFQKRLAKTSRALGGGIGDAYMKIEGFPMETEMGEIKTVVTKVESRTTAASEFEVPSGYQKEAIPLPPAGKR